MVNNPNFASPLLNREVTMCNPGADGAGKLHQGYWEGANVDVTTEMVRLMELARWVEVLDGAMVLVK